MNINKNKKSNNSLEKQITLLQQITTNLQTTKNENLPDQIQQYGLINYTRTQYLPQLSKTITENEEYKNLFYNYTSIESMILDILPLIEANTINKIEKQEKNTEKTNKLIQFTTKLLKILEQILTTQDQDKNTQKIFNIQNQFYKLIYDEKIDYRIK